MQRTRRSFLKLMAAGAAPVALSSRVLGREGAVAPNSRVNISAKLGRRLRWDAAAERVVGDDEANALLTRPQRAAWSVPGC